jgi:hypothetical protein
VHDIENTGAPDWFKDAERMKISGLADVPLAYDPLLTGDSKLEFVRQERSEEPDLARCWLQKEPARALPSLARTPVVIISGEASYHAAYDHCTAAYLNQAGVRNTHIRLAELGVHGNGHLRAQDMTVGNLRDNAEFYRAVWELYCAVDILLTNTGVFKIFYNSANVAMARPRAPTAYPARKHCERDRHGLRNACRTPSRRACRQCRLVPS